MGNVRKNLFKSTVAIMLAIIMMLGFVNVSHAEDVTRGIVKSTNATNHDFNRKDIEVWSAKVGAGNTSGQTSDVQWPFYTTVISQEGIDSNKFVVLDLVERANDGSLNAQDAALFSQMEMKGVDSYEIANQLAQKFGVDASKIKVEITVAMPEKNEKVVWNIVNGALRQNEETAESYRNKIYEYCKERYISGENSFYDGFSGTEEEWNNELEIQKLRAAEVQGITDENQKELWARDEMIRNKDCTVVSARGILPDGTVYHLVVGDNDEWEKDFLLERETLAEFKTELSYIAIDSEGKTDEGKMGDTTFLPPYYDNDNTKKDMDAIVIIKSKTHEGIVKTNDVDMNEDGSANSLGWFYVDTTDLTVIAKKYPFDAYDNTTANGMVSENIKLTGEYGGEDIQNPSIKWTFRRIKKEETTNSDGSITVTITYNLPIDTNKIPEGWEAVYDEGSTTSAHKIRKTIKKGENYEKDVIAKQNGTDATVTTHVAKVWAIPQAGESIAFVIAIAIIGFVLITRARKSHSMKNIK